MKYSSTSPLLMSFLYCIWLSPLLLFFSLWLSPLLLFFSLRLSPLLLFFSLWLSPLLLFFSLRLPPLLLFFSLWLSPLLLFFSLWTLLSSFSFLCGSLLPFFLWLFPILLFSSMALSSLAYHLQDIALPLSSLAFFFLWLSSYKGELCLPPLLTLQYFL